MARCSKIGMYKMAKATAESRDDAIQLVIETEFPSVLIEDVELLSRKVQRGLIWEAAVDALIARGDQVGPEEQSVLAAACERLRELEKLPDDALQDAVRANKLKLETKEKERLLLEDQKLFHTPAMVADFEHYRLHAYWDMHEATCLLLGKDPRRLKQTFLLNSPGGSPFAAQFRELTDILTRAVEAGLIGDEVGLRGGEWRIDPARLVPWAIGKGIYVPEALATAFRRPESDLRPGPSDDDLQSSIAAPAGSSTGLKTAMSYAELEQKVKDLEAKSKTEKSSNTKWRKSTLLIISGLLHAKLGSTARDKPASVSEVMNFLDRVLNRGLTENTVRSRMKEIGEIMDEIQRDSEQAAKEDRAAK